MVSAGMDCCDGLASDGEVEVGVHATKRNTINKGNINLPCMGGVYHKIIVSCLI